VAARALRAFLHGGDEEDELTGSLLVAEGLDHLRVCAQFVIAYAKAGRKRRRR
jgi:hypothetical protein